jgi:hypothetical protein
MIKELNRNPGPGGYSQTAQTATKNKGPSYGFGTDQKKIYNSNGPGPGSYKIPC